LAVGERLFELGIIDAEPLQKAFNPVAPPLHPPEVVRRRHHEKDRKQNVVQRPHGDFSILIVSSFPQSRLPRKENVRGGTVLEKSPGQPAPATSEKTPTKPPAASAARRA